MASVTHFSGYNTQLACVNDIRNCILATFISPATTRIKKNIQRRWKMDSNDKQQQWTTTDKTTINEKEQEEKQEQEEQEEQEVEE